MKVLITSNSFGQYDPEPIKLLQNLGWEIIRNPHGKILSEEDMIELVEDVDAIILGSDPVTKNVLESGKKLKVISRYGVGIDNIDVQTAREKGIEIARTVNANAEAVADYTVGLMISTLRHISEADNDLKNKKWRKYTGLDLNGKTIGVFGLGAIAKGVIRRLSGFDCKFIATDPFVDDEFCKKYNVEIMDADSILRNADVVTLHFPGNPDGTPLITSEKLALMKTESILINTARASIVDEDAVLNALNTDRLYGYGTDVFSTEPDIPEKFMNQSRVVLSPHMAAVSKGAINRMSEMAVNNILNYFERGK